MDSNPTTSIAEPSVYIVGGPSWDFVNMFRRMGFKNSTTIRDADVVCFTGGSDVTPALYGEKVIPQTHFNIRRDDMEAEAFGEALGYEKFMVGVCRGGQFLNVMNGGKMWQDVDRHTRSHQLTDLETGTSIMVTSTHHQMMRPTNNAIIVATAKESMVKECASRLWFRAPLKDNAHSLPGKYPADICVDEEGDDVDVEVCYYADSRSLCFQPHPEYDYLPSCTAYFRSLMDRFFVQQRKAA